MKKYIGVDGGGTKTEFAICDETGYILRSVKTGPSNPIFVDKNITFKHLNEGFKQLMDKYDEVVECCTICIPGMKPYMGEIEKNYSKICKRVIITADELNTYYSAVGDTVGIVVLSGTGSFVIGKNEKDEIKSFGGWGPLAGDEGSGYYIGISCLKEVIRAYENKLDISLTNEVKKYFNIHDISELRTALYKQDVNREKIAGLCLSVRNLAVAGDQIALNIISKAGEELAILAKTAIEHLNLQNQSINVVLTGGVSKMKELIVKPFEENIKTVYPKVNIQKPRFEPYVGALIMSLKASNIVVTEEILNQLEKSCKIFYKH